MSFTDTLKSILSTTQERRRREELDHEADAERGRLRQAAIEGAGTRGEPELVGKDTGPACRLVDLGHQFGENFAARYSLRRDTVRVAKDAGRARVAEARAAADPLISYLEADAVITELGRIETVSADKMFRERSRTGGA